MILFMTKFNFKLVGKDMVIDIFELNRCWMRGDENKRWLFAAMGLTIQMHQLEEFKIGKSTWNIKERVLGYIPRPLK